MFSICKVKEALALQHSIVMNLLLLINREQKKNPLLYLKKASDQRYFNVF